MPNGLYEAVLFLGEKSILPHCCCIHWRVKLVIVKWNKSKTIIEIC